MFLLTLFEVLNVGNAIRKTARADKITWAILNVRLDAFTYAYLMAKWACVSLAVNVILWKETNLAHATNLNAAVGVLLLMGLFFVSLPRYYVILMWREFQARTDDSGGKPVFSTLGDDRAQFFISMADVVLIGLLLKNVAGLSSPIIDVDKLIFK